MVKPCVTFCSQPASNAVFACTGVFTSQMYTSKELSISCYLQKALHKIIIFFFLSLVLQLKTQLLNSSWGTADIRSCSDTKVLSWSESVCKAGTKCLRLRAHSAALVVMGGPCPGLCNTSCLPTPNSSPSLAMVVVPQASPATQVQMEVPQTKVISTRHWKAVWDS